MPTRAFSGLIARAIIATQPHNFLRVVRSEATLPERVDPYGPAVYEEARKNFEQLQNDGEPVRESAPQIYLYRQIMNGHAHRAARAQEFQPLTGRAQADAETVHDVVHRHGPRCDEEQPVDPPDRFR